MQSIRNNQFVVTANDSLMARGNIITWIMRDDIIVTVSNPIPADNSLKYPTIICRRNKKYSEDLYVNYKNELENVISLSTEATDNNLIAFWGKIQRTRN